ncbi:MAG TPA: flagellar hook capping FlgD N-terminal domain-containing protein [Nakamurella sp.]|nr:flagellar hook capping FlgD N-terminal domain-containing protein [Nakamurella sp.]
MTVPSVTGSTGTSSTPTDTSGALSMDQLGGDTFLKLMVAQLRNQDPMNPTDSTQFLAQTAQFTTVEKLTTMAAQTTQALTLQRDLGAAGMVGRTVSYTAADGSQAQGAVDSVRFTDAGPVLAVGSDEVPLDSVLGVTA